MRLSLCLCAVALASGCASLFSEGRQPVSFTTAPEGAEVMVNGQFVGTTPITTRIDRAMGETVVTLRSPGYRTRQFRLTKTLNSMAILNLSSALLWATDFSTGALIEYAPDAYFVELEPDRRGGPPSGYDRREAAALRFVLVSRRDLLRDVSRRRGEHLQALARLLEVGEDDYPRLVEALAGEMETLAPLEEKPHALFERMLAVLETRGLVGWADRRS